MKRHLVIIFISTSLLLLLLNIFKPIFSATSLIFPYSISKFDLILKYPTFWKYIKITYSVTCFFTIYLFVNSFSKFLLMKKSKKVKNVASFSQVSNDDFSLLIGINELTNHNVYIPQSGLYQNILVTGTIGSRKDFFCHVSFIKSIIKI